MPCPTCDHTMAAICDVESWTVYQCGRCGTSLVCHAVGAETDVVTHVPKLVERCQDFATVIGSDMHRGAWPGKFWHRIGIHESINKPEAR